MFSRQRCFAPLFRQRQSVASPHTELRPRIDVPASSDIWLTRSLDDVNHISHPSLFCQYFSFSNYPLPIFGLHLQDALRAGIMADEELTPELYACNGCIEQIPQHRARISCHSCPDYHLCANCFVIKQFVKPHTVSHATLILKRSGVVVPPPPGFNAKTGPALPPRPTISVNTGTSPAPRAVVRTQPEMPTANWGALWNVLKPKDKRMRQASVVDSNIKEVDKRTVSSDSMMSGTHGSAESTPPLPLRPIAPIRMESQAPSYPMPNKWEPLFEADSTPNSIFVALMSTIFSQLDPEHTGVLRPETYSDFLDLQGYELGSNICESL